MNEIAWLMEKLADLEGITVKEEQVGIESVLLDNDEVMGIYVPEGRMVTTLSYTLMNYTNETDEYLAIIGRIPESKEVCIELIEKNQEVIYRRVW